MNETRQTRKWHKLDNTANLFPVITSKRFSNVYRLSITLAEPVIPELLQQALETVLPWFSAFRTRMRHGMFWQYFEVNPAKPTIYPEDDYPCGYIDAGQNNHFLFRVSYYENRINLEIFHVLTDGTGGMQFLQALCCQYLMLAHPSAFTDEDKRRHWFAQHGNDTEDSYVANYTPTKKANFRDGRGYRLRGERTTLEALGVIHAYLPLDQLLAVARASGTSVTQYLTACIGWAVYTTQMRSQPPSVPLNIFLPVNLRNLFPSTTALNFFSNIYISLDFKQPDITFDDVLAEVKTQFAQKLTKEAMLERISYTVGSGYSPLVRAVPLPLKNMALRAIFEASAGTSTMGYSNLGRVSFPPAFEPFVAGVSLLLSGAPREPFKCTSCSYGNTFTISFTSMLRDTSIQRETIRHLTGAGLDAIIETNGVKYEDL